MAFMNDLNDSTDTGKRHYLCIRAKLDVTVGVSAHGGGDHGEQMSIRSKTTQVKKLPPQRTSSGTLLTVENPAGAASAAPAFSYPEALRDARVYRPPSGYNARLPFAFRARPERCPNHQGQPR